MKNVSVTASGNVSATKWYKLSYSEPINNNGTNNRFFLSKLSYLDVTTGGGNSNDLNLGNWLTHDFEYDDINGMPARLSYAQDWWGYYNGANNAYFAPYIASIASSVQYANNGGNREPGTLEQMQKGMLKKVTYPTGGSESFTYERHTLSRYTSTPTNSVATASGSGTGSMSPWTHYSSTFTATSNHQAFPDAPSGEGDKIYELKLKKTSTGEVVFLRRYYYYSSGTSSVALQANTSYQMELTILGEMNAGSANIHYNFGTNTAYENKIVGGVRVKEIISFDPVAEKTNKKYYTYAALTDLTKSSGEGALFPINYIEYKTGMTCNAGTMGISIGVCENYMVSSSSITPYYTFGGSPIAYRNVIESDDPNFANGFTEHFFHAYYPGTSSFNILLGNSLLGSPSNITSDENGMEYKTHVYKRSGTTNILVKEIQNNYEDGGIGTTKQSLIVRQRWIEPHEYNPPSPAQFEGYDLVQYNYSSRWKRLQSTITTDYDQWGQNPMTNTTTYIYENNTHLQPTRIETTNSKGELIKTVNKYPIDFVSSNPASPNVYNAMVDKHIITPPLQLQTFKGTSANFLQHQKTNYDFFLSNSLIAPKNIEAAVNSGSPEIRVSFNLYNNKGQILEHQKANDVQMAYIWGYAPERPIAEVINATAIDVAYTSFEAGGGTGNWTINSTLRDGTLPVTGMACYSLANGAVSKAINSGKIYIVSYWTKNSGPFTITGTQGAAFAGRSIDGWKYFEHKISGVSTLQLSGSGLIDELRLYPDKAQMVTYTYDPLVGVTSHTDAGSRTTYYEYDGLQRLLRIRDPERKILKQYEYAYNQAVATCVNVTPNWQPTGVYQCVKNSTNNNNTGDQQQEQKDMNSCSPTYNDTRWVYVGVNTTSCPVVPNCTGENQRVINGQCETGTKVITNQYFQNGIMHCTYHYEWSDGYWSPNYQNSGSSNCMVEM